MASSPQAASATPAQLGTAVSLRCLESEVCPFGPGLPSADQVGLVAVDGAGGRNSGHVPLAGSKPPARSRASSLQGPSHSSIPPVHPKPGRGERAQLVFVSQAPESTLPCRQQLKGSKGKKISQFSRVCSAAAARAPLPQEPPPAPPRGVKAGPGG